MENSPRISVIIPVYGVEKYIDTCLESIVGQTYKNLEIILVDDASTDGSGKKCDEWALKDRRITVQRKSKNAGLNMARKTGFDVSNGEYVTFIDSDDFVDREYIERLLQAALRADADISICGYEHFNDSTQESASGTYDEQTDATTVYTKDKMIKMYLTATAQWTHTGNPANAHCKLFKHSIIDGIDWKLSDYSVGEDDFMSLQFYNVSSKNVVIDDKLYLYRNNPNSLSSSKKYCYKYGSKAISPFQLCDNYHGLAAKLLGDKYIPQILYKTYTLYVYYIWNAIQKECLSATDVVLFDKIFPLNDILMDKKHDYDNELLETLKDGGLLSYISLVLNTFKADFNKRDAEIARLGSVINDRDAEIARLGSVINDRDAEIARLHVEFSSIKRSMRLVMGNIKRRIRNNTRG